MTMILDISGVIVSTRMLSCMITVDTVSPFPQAEKDRPAVAIIEMAIVFLNNFFIVFSCFLFSWKGDFTWSSSTEVQLGGAFYRVNEMKTVEQIMCAPK